MNECPRCRGTEKFEASERVRVGCASWWHQFVWLPNIWPDRERMRSV